MIDPNEAPEGFVAKPGDTCDGCWFFANNEQGCPDVECHQSGRKDGEDVIFIALEKSNLAEFSATGELAEAKAEAAQWKLAHDQVCRKFADCENARDENAKLWEQSQDEAARWKAACLERDELIAKLKSQLTTAIKTIDRMR